MKVGQRGQVVIPKALREEYGLLPQAEVEFIPKRDGLKLRKLGRKRGGLGGFTARTRGKPTTRATASKKPASDTPGEKTNKRPDVFDRLCGMLKDRRVIGDIDEYIRESRGRW